MSVKTKNGDVVNNSNQLHKVEKLKEGDLVKLKESYLTEDGNQIHTSKLWNVHVIENGRIFVQSEDFSSPRFLEVKEDDVLVLDREKLRQEKLEEMKKKNEERKQKLISRYSHFLDDYDGRLNELWDELDEYRRVVENNGFDGGIHDCYSLMNYIEDLGEMDI